MAAIDSTFITTALSGTRSERKTIIRSRNDNASTAAKKTGRALGEEVGEVDVGGGRPGDLDVERCAGDRGGDDVVAQGRDEFGGGRVLGCGRRDEVDR